MNKNYKPGHKLTAFVLIILCLYGLMAVGGSWTPRLGLDLSGGTTVTLTARSTNTSANETPADASASATTSPTASSSAAPTASPSASASPTASSSGAGTQGGGVTSEAMQEALSIVQQRVDSLGVGNSSIVLQGTNQIQVAVPNVDPQQLTDLVGATAQLGFRNVFGMSASPSAPRITSPALNGQVGFGQVRITGTTVPDPTPEGSTSGSPSTTVSVTETNGASCTATADADGNWWCDISLTTGATTLTSTTTWGGYTATSLQGTWPITVTNQPAPPLPAEPTESTTPGESASPTATGTDTATPTATATAAASESATATAAAPSSSTTAQRRVAPMLPTAPPTIRPTTAGQNENSTFDDLMAWQPTDQDTGDFGNWSCDLKAGADSPYALGRASKEAPGTPLYPDGTPIVDVWDQPLFSCGQDTSYKYLLGPVIIAGTHVTSATAGVPQGQVAYQVNLEFDSVGASQFSTATTKLVGQTSPENQFAIVLDGKVVSAPQVNEAITGGRAQITGSFTADEAQNLARVLRYGALPLTFEVSSASTVSPTLGGEQLRAGIIAGIIGLVLTLLYAALYYRALSIIVIGSLFSAGIITYSAIVLLGTTVGFALDLPGIAGAILAIGVTADSFIVYFERIRDEIRDGYSLAHSIESGWTKARGTIVIADAVQILSALVLFFLAIGSVRGFAFTLLVTTLIDLFIVFFFSKPLMTLLGRTRYFRSGNPMSGFDPEHLGVSAEALRGRRASTGTVKTKSKEA